MIKPLDLTQCQAEITTGVSLQNFMTMGGAIAKTERCTNKPTVVVTEIEPGKDGQKGYMSLCEGCLAVFKKQLPSWRKRITVTDVP